LAIVGLVVGIMMVASLLPDVVDEAASTAYSDTFTVVTTSETETTQTLSHDHYYGDTRRLSATSDHGPDNPTIMAYDANTNEVTVAGLAVDQTRLLTISYYKEAHQQYTGFSGFLRLVPFLALIGLVVAALWGLFAHMKRE